MSNDIKTNFEGVKYVEKGLFRFNIGGFSFIENIDNLTHIRDCITKVLKESAIVKPKVIKIYADGCCKGDGNGGAGFVVYFDDQEVLSGNKYLENCTNNEAEYHSLILALFNLFSSSKYRGFLLDNNVQKKFYMDSKLVVNQVLDKWKINFARLSTLKLAIKNYLDRMVSWKLIHIRREFNTRADEEANKGYNSGKDI